MENVRVRIYAKLRGTALSDDFIDPTTCHYKEYCVPKEAYDEIVRQTKGDLLTKISKDIFLAIRKLNAEEVRCEFIKMAIDIEKELYNLGRY